MTDTHQQNLTMMPELLTGTVACHPVLPAAIVANVVAASSWNTAGEDDPPYWACDMSCSHVNVPVAFSDGNVMYKPLEAEVDEATNPPRSFQLCQQKRQVLDRLYITMSHACCRSIDVFL